MIAHLFLRSLLCLSGLLLCALPSVPARAASALYQLDPVHTRVVFALGHAGFSKAIGTVSGSTGTLVFDAQDWSSARVEVSVPMQRLDLGDEKWNQAVSAGTLLDIARFPAATFVSTRVQPVDARHAAVHGWLTLHGVSREVKLDVVFNALKRHPLPPFRRTAGFSATTTISRADFGIDAWPSLIGDEVELRLEVEAVRARQPGDSAAEDPAKSPSNLPTEPTP